MADYGLSATMEVLLCADGSGKVSSNNNSATGPARNKCMAWRSTTLRWTAPELLGPMVDGPDPFTTASDVYR